MTLTSTRRSANHWPGLDGVPEAPGPRVAARVARRLFRRPSTGSTSLSTRDKTVGRAVRSWS